MHVMVEVQAHCMIKICRIHSCDFCMTLYSFILFMIVILTVQLISSIIPPSILLAQYNQGHSGLSKTSLDSKQEPHNTIVSNLRVINLLLFMFKLLNVLKVKITNKLVIN